MRLHRAAGGSDLMPRRSTKPSGCCSRRAAWAGSGGSSSRRPCSRCMPRDGSAARPTGMPFSSSMMGCRRCLIRRSLRSIARWRWARRRGRQPGWRRSTSSRGTRAWSGISLTGRRAPTCWPVSVGGRARTPPMRKRSCLSPTRRCAAFWSRGGQGFGRIPFEL